MSRGLSDDYSNGQNMGWGIEEPEPKKQEEFWAHSLQQFINEMFDKLIAQIPTKGHPTKERLQSCPKEYLIKKLQEHLQAENFADVANFAFLLDQRASLESRSIDKSNINKMSTDFQEVNKKSGSDKT